MFVYLSGQFVAHDTGLVITANLQHLHYLHLIYILHRKQNFHLKNIYGQKQKILYFFTIVSIPGVTQLTSVLFFGGIN